MHYHVIALGVSLEAMQIDTDVTFCSKISGSQQKVKKGKKVHILKFKRRKHSMKQQGHRQLFTEVQIGKIKA